MIPCALVFAADMAAGEARVAKRRRRNEILAMKIVQREEILQVGGKEYYILGVN